MLDESLNQIKIIDFGLAIFYSKNKQNDKIGTPYYTCPEIINNTGYDEKCDIWSLGVCLSRSLSGFYPFDGDDIDELINSIRNQ